MIDLRAAAFQAAAWVYPGASPYIYPARTTPGHWNTQCDVHWHYQFRRTALAPFLEYDDNHTYSDRTREEKDPFHRDCSTRCSQFPIFNCNPLPIEYLPLQQSLRFLDLPLQQKPSISSLLPSPCLPPHHAPPPSHKVCIRVARDGTIKAAVMTVGWTQSHLRTCTHCLSCFTWSLLPHDLRGQTNTAHNL